MNVSIKPVNITRYSHQRPRTLEDFVPVEEPLEIRILFGPDGQRTTTPISVTMRTPGHDHELAAGFLFTEGLVHQREHIIGTPVEENIVSVELVSSLSIDQPSIARNFYTTSSCGVCGKSSIEAIRVASQVVAGSFSVLSSVLKSLPSAIILAQQNFQTTGGLHASGLFDAAGKLLLLREDVGRHNALDKVIGCMLLADQIPLSNCVLLLSGRVSFELIQKAAVAGIPVVAAIGAPSSLAVELAQEKGITLIGFLKHDRFNIYSHPNRIIEND